MVPAAPRPWPRDGIENASAAERFAARQQRSLPRLDRLKTRLDKPPAQVVDQTAPGKAVNDRASNWSRLLCYTESGHLPIDDNRAENAIRPCVIGRKNWLCSDTPKGAAQRPTLQTAKANGQEPYAWLRQVPERLPLAEGRGGDCEALLPWNCKPTAAS